MKEMIFHGGPLKSDSFGGHSFWTSNFRQAADYADGEELYVAEIDWAAEVIKPESSYLAEGAYENAADADDNWGVQTAAILAAVVDGATAVECDDGMCLVGVERLNPRRVTLAEAREIWEDAQ